VPRITPSHARARELRARALRLEGKRAGDGRTAVERHVSPESRNRLDAGVTFAGLPPEVMGRVVEKFVAEVAEQLRERRVAIELSDAARSWLAGKGYDPVFGARPMARVIQTELKDRLADELLFGRLARGGRVRVDAGPDGLAIEVEGGES
jgi:ATP-dependent Clp protease ATP-binding subunit ClpA